jgi:NAD(P)-dependent dehydrogenase (short-subunit alcohol dehydrogenase family)
MRRLDEAVAIVTGAGSGNGLAIATALASEGCAVVIGEYSEERGAAAAEGINRTGGRARFVRTDVSRWADIDQLVGFTLSEFGVPHILVNNAGVLDGYATCADTSEELFDRVIAINLKGVFFGCKRVLPEMVRARYGKSSTSPRSRACRPRRGAPPIRPPSTGSWASPGNSPARSARAGFASTPCAPVRSTRNSAERPRRSWAISPPA